MQIIGWLYQYYNSELKDKVFADLKKNVKISKENIPAATQLFTPDWIVRYMVENSLGRLWLEGHPNDALKSEWKYYLDEAPQEDSVQLQLNKIRADFAKLKPEDIRVIDPCMGSGHILCVLFDALVKIYESYGYTAREAAFKIVEHNLWGLDIDERAAQLAYFAVMMKARQYDRRFFTRNVTPHIYAINETNALREDYRHAKYYFRLSKDNQATLDYLIDAFADAKEYGSIIQLGACDYRALELEWATVKNNVSGLWAEALVPAITHLIQQAIALSQKYHVVATNPPYMSTSNVNETLAAYVKKNFPDSKSDLSTVFMEKCRALTQDGFYYAMINIPVWMFISSYEKLRHKLLAENIFINMTHNGRGIFGSDFGTTSFIIANIALKNFAGKYRRLFNAQVEVKSNEVRKQEFLSGKGEYISRQNNFSKIPGSPIAYWVSEKIMRLFDTAKNIRDYAEPRHGMSTGNNVACLKLWHEVCSNKINYSAKNLVEFDESHKKFAPYKKGGDYRIWYGNNDYVIAYDKNSRAIMEKFSGYRSSSTQFFFKESINWSYISSGSFGVRISPAGFIFDGMGSSMFCNKEIGYYIAGIMTSKIAKYILAILNSTMSFSIENIASIPVIFDTSRKAEIDSLVSSCIELSRADWDAFETSWDFKEHPFITAAASGAVTIKQAYDIWQSEAEERFNKLKTNEEELNRIFIDIYGLGDELTPEVENKDVTVRRADF